MARTVNIEELEAKRRLIILGALELIKEKGYEGFSVNQVIAHCKISKGSFFHHFDSKNSLLEGLVEYLITPVAEAYDELFEASQSAPRELIKEMFESTSKIKMSKEMTIAAYMQLLQSEENKVLFYKITQKTYDALIPYYEEVCIRGVESGDFKFEGPRGVARQFLKLIMKTNERLGSLMYMKNDDPAEWQILSEELEAFEMIARFLFGFEKTYTLYPNEFYGYINGMIR